MMRVVSAWVSIVHCPEANVTDYLSHPVGFPKNCLVRLLHMHIVTAGLLLQTFLDHFFNNCTLLTFASEFILMFKLILNEFLCY